MPKTSGNISVTACSKDRKEHWTAASWNTELPPNRLTARVMPPRHVAVRAAKRVESAVLWLGWRLHPRTFAVDSVPVE